ncbi:hypothetical protein M493_13495 [Geobacillus genomosp. 3]|uniref:Uncharacterized protein n=1 Tax=Geobacillus genomosp. 3 TaxID=1921421 RepID=S5ZF22_GEOG3|nr:hypothetical protein M493_13495 [Geobacillus genomosp. 3]
MKKAASPPFKPMAGNDYFFNRVGNDDFSRLLR